MMSPPQREAFLPLYALPHESTDLRATRIGFEARSLCRGPCDRFFPPVDAHYHRCGKTHLNSVRSGQRLFRLFILGHDETRRSLTFRAMQCVATVAELELWIILEGIVRQT